MNDNIEFKGVPKGKEKDRLYYTPKLENAKVNNDSPLIKELDKLVKGEIPEIDIKTLKEKIRDTKK